MSQDRNIQLTQHLLIEDDALEQMIIASLETAEAEGQPVILPLEPADDQLAGQQGEQARETVAASTHDIADADLSSSGLRYDDAGFTDGLDSIGIVSIPLSPVPSTGLLDLSELTTGEDLPGTTASLDQVFQAPASGVTVLDYQPLVKPDNPGGGNGGGGGGGGGGKGGGKPDKPGDGGPTDPGTDVVDSYTSGPDGGYNIHIDFLGTWTHALQAAFIDSADLISTLITGDVPDITYQGVYYDDITITAELANIDGPGGVLGQAGPTLIRTGSGQPIAATMEFDSADAENFDAQGLWNDIVLHEMLHSVGLGTVWNYAGLLDGYGTANPLFNGEFANLAYDDLFADLNQNLSDLIPVEGDGGPGTAYGHWDEATFGNELMTGYINASNYLSAMTVASLEDLGYATTWDASAPGETGVGTIIV